MYLIFMSFRAPSAALNQKKLSVLPKYATHEYLILGAISVHNTSPLDYRFKIFKRVLTLL